VDEYVRYALSQNPQIQASRKRVEAAAQKVPQAASLSDPTFSVMGFPFYPYVQQTAGGRMQADMQIAQEVPWFGKLDAQASAAEAEVDQARAELVAAELGIVEQVKRAYYELYYVQRAIDITERSRELAVSFSEIARRRFENGQASQQDYLRAELEVSNLDTELVRLRQELQSGQARLARLLHVSPETPVEAVTELPPDQVPRDLDRLYTQAVALRPELHAQLAAVRRDRYATDLARLQYFPDLTFAFGYGPMTTSKALAPTADGIDNITIGVMANLPLYHNRLRAGVHEAEANVVASAREYDNLRDQTQEEIKDLFAQTTSQQELLRLFDAEIIPKADQTLQVSIPAYEAQQIDFLQLIDNWRQLLRFQLMQQRLEAQLRQTLATMERTVGGTLPPGGPAPAENPPLPQVPPVQERP
jgi:outer membrane protein TolC